jgi:hypothetical protein
LRVSRGLFDFGVAIDIPFPSSLQDGATAADHAPETRTTCLVFCTDPSKIAQSVFSQGLSITDDFVTCER